MGCTCEQAEDCDPGLVCRDSTCIETACGDGVIEGLEACDDGNTKDGDRCDADCTFTEILAVDASYRNTCVLVEGGRVRCWGFNLQGQLGYGNTENIGDDEPPAEVGDVMLPGAVEAISSGDAHTCALIEGAGEVWCWGEGSSGKLGYGNVQTVGDDEFPSTLPAVEVGVEVLQIAAGGIHSCARTVAGLRHGAGDTGPGARSATEIPRASGTMSRLRPQGTSRSGLRSRRSRPATRTPAPFSRRAAFGAGEEIRAGNSVSATP